MRSLPISIESSTLAQVLAAACAAYDEEPVTQRYDRCTADTMPAPVLVQVAA